MAWHDGLNDRLRWFIQRTRDPKKYYRFYCESCHGYAQGISEGRQTVKSKKGKPLEYDLTVYRHDFDSLEHVTQREGYTNPLVHSEDCKWLKEYLAFVSPVLEPVIEIQAEPIKEDQAVVALYCDGGVISKNPSPFGGTWAWCGVNAEGKRVIEQGGIIEAVDGRPVTNNWTEQIAITKALEAMPSGWSGTVYSDSQIALGRVFKGWSTSNLPANIKERGIVALKRLGKVKHTLLQGHPTKEDLKRGIGAKRGYPVSEHNVWCDKECGRQSEIYKIRNFKIIRTDEKVVASESSL